MSLSSPVIRSDWGPQGPFFWEFFGESQMQSKIFLALLSCLPFACAEPKNTSPAEVEKLIERVMQVEQVPGLAVGIWHKGESVLVRGFGITNTDQPKPVDAHTLFKLASTTKAFTAAALALLVDEGKLQWDSRVVEYLPGFILSDPWITREFRVEDLLTHRSGLGLGAGDLMLWPQPNHFTRQDILAGLGQLPLRGKFRADYAYDNLLYIVAGELVAAVSGQTFEEFVENRLLAKLGLRDCYAGPVPQQARSNLADPHILIRGEVTVDAANLASNLPLVSAAAGGMHCSAADMLRWLQTLLAGGVMADGERLLSRQARDRLWQPVTLMPLSAERAQRDQGQFYAYALGWRIQDMYGKRVIHHTGSLSGMYAWTAMVPELDLALVVLMNRSSEIARQTLIYSLLMPYLGASERDWLSYFQQAQAEQEKIAQQKAVPKSDFPIADNALPGIYGDAWFGEAKIELGHKGLRLHSLKSPRLSGSLQAESPGVWRLEWDDRTLGADAWLVSGQSETGAKSFTLHPQSPDIDFSYDFQDLLFVQSSAHTEK
jgi:CubicO group peptidase (beta-lactamase class C family)